MLWNYLASQNACIYIYIRLMPPPPSPLQLLAIDRPNELISSFPLVMIPVFLVPLSVLLHLASLKKLRQTDTKKRDLNPLQPGIARAHRTV